MGRHRAGRKKRRKACTRNIYGSDPESTDCRQSRREESKSEGGGGWDSLDEGALLIDYVLNAAEGCGTLSEEMEVTKRLSCLNFSMLPCAADALMSGGGGVGESDCSELPSATQLGSMPGVATGDSFNRRQGRKRAARRKLNKKLKKARSSMECHNRCNRKSCPHHHHPISTHLPSSVSMPSKKWTGQEHEDEEEEEEEATVMYCGDAPSGGDVEMLMHNECGGTAEAVHHQGCSESSELSESSTDSGCDGDDEASSVEHGMSHSRVGLGGGGGGRWWEKDSLPSSDEEGFQQIISGVFPLMSEEGQRTASEFKHPGNFGIRGSVRKKRRKPSQCSTSITPHEVNQKIVAFIQKPSETQLRFQLVSRALCRTISNLASTYNLRYVVEHKRRLPVASPLLVRTSFTRMANQDEVERILKNHGRDRPLLLKTPHSDPSAVGDRAPPLDESNIGNRMLQGMGWTPGTGLGAHSVGIQEPIFTCMRPRHAGLGYC